MNTEKLISNMAATFDKLAEEIASRTIGDHVLKLLQRDGTVSVQSLQDSLNQAIAAASQAPANLGRIQHEKALQAVHHALNPAHAPASDAPSTPAPATSNLSADSAQPEQ